MQDPRKDVIPQRDLFPTRVALRLNEAEHVTWCWVRAHGTAAPYCDLIPDTLPGVGYVRSTASPNPSGSGSAHYTDDDIAGLGQQAATQRHAGPSRTGADQRNSGMTALSLRRRRIGTHRCRLRAGRRQPRRRWRPGWPGPDLGRWLGQVQQVRQCARPVRLVGSSDTIDAVDR